MLIQMPQKKKTQEQLEDKLFVLTVYTKHSIQNNTSPYTINHISLTQKCNIQAHLYLNRFLGVLSSYFTFQVNVNRHKIEFTIYIHKPQFYT